MRLLIVGKLHGYIGTASKIAMTRGAQVTHVDSVDMALVTLRSGKGADIIMIDVALDIKELNTSLSRERFTIPIVACGVGTDSAPAVRAIHAGAKEYIPMPPNAELIASVLEAVTSENNTFIAHDPAMTAIVRLADQIAPSEASILITGESGTGKEVMARYLHRQSRRKTMPFISINCAAIPDNLLESELFGHEKGAFTGAVARRIGKFEEANGGTLLLDEITEMHPSLQAKLLRAIQEREIDRVGGSKPIKVDIRIIATSNRDMEQAVSLGQFREDLYFRLNVMTIHLPALRERPGDIEKLAEHFMAKYVQVNGLTNRTLSSEARNMLRTHQWRGNIRELENTMHRAVLLTATDEITLDVLQISGLKRDVKPTIHNTMITPVADNNDSVPNAMIGRSMADVEKDLILGTLDHCLGNRTHAATILGISIRTLRNKLKQYADEYNNAESAGYLSNNYQEAI